MEFNVFCKFFLAVSLSKISGALLHDQEVQLTMYWVEHENNYPLGSDILIKTCKGVPLASVSREFADKLRLEGSGTLRNGKFVNLSSYCQCKGGYSCFEMVAAPLGSRQNPLESFVSVAANDIPFGSKLYVKEIDGLFLPNGKKHNGCVRVDDVCSACNNHHIDLYVVEWQNYKLLDAQLGDLPYVKVHIQNQPDCNEIKYT